MSKDTEGASSEPENALLAPLTSDKFQGFATKDGEPLDETSAAKEKAGKEKPVKAVSDKAAKAAVEGAGDADEGDEGGEEAAGDQSTPEAKAKSAQQRINKAVGRQRAAERARDAAAQENRSLSERLARLEGQLGLLTSGNKAPTKDRNAPDPADYKNGDIDAQYIADLARYEARKTTSAEREASDKAAKAKADAEASKALQKRVSDFDAKGSEKYDDFHDVVFDDDFPLSPTLGDLALDSEHGPEILYTLAGDSKESRRVLGLTPARQAAWFGAREAELSSESSDADGEDEDSEEEESPPKTTKAPPPLSKTRGNGGVSRINAATSDFAAFERMTKGQNGR